MKFTVERIRGKPNHWRIMDEYCTGKPLPAGIVTSDFLAQCMTTEEFSALVNTQGPVAIDFSATPDVWLPEGPEDLTPDESDMVHELFESRKG